MQTVPLPPIDSRANKFGVPTVSLSTNHKPPILCFDFEGVFIPEVWIAIAEACQVEELRLTTRDIADYDQLMQGRLALLKEHDITIEKIQSIISDMEPLPGAAEFLANVREKAQVLIITDSYYDFIAPFLPKLSYPTVYAHTLGISEHGHVESYHLRTTDGKRKVIESLRAMGFRTMAVGDSYNDTTMLLAADDASLFCPPPNVVADFPQLKTSGNYAKLSEYIDAFLNAS